MILDGKGGDLCEHGHALANGTQGKTSGKSIIGLEHLTPISKVGVVCPDVEVVILPQFTDCVSITKYINDRNIYKDRNLQIVNNLVQPELKFDGVKPTTGSITFVNNSTISGDDLGSPALLVEYAIKLENNGTLIEKNAAVDAKPNSAIEGIHNLDKDSILGTIRTD